MFVLIATRYVTAYAFLARSARLESSGTSLSVCCRITHQNAIALNIKRRQRRLFPVSY